MIKLSKKTLKELYSLKENKTGDIGCNNCCFRIKLEECTLNISRPSCSEEYAYYYQINPIKMLIKELGNTLDVKKI
jgi:hypothetical protein